MNKSYMTGKLSLMALLMCVLTVFSSCEKDYKLELPLAVTQNELSLGAGGGTTHVLVYSTGDWTATLKNEADASWATIEQGSGKENGEFIFTYAVNPSIQRKAVVVIKSGSETEEIEMVQAGYLTSPELVLEKKILALPTWGSSLSLGFETNMGLALDRVKTKVEYGDISLDSDDDVELTPATKEEPGWLTDVIVAEDSVTFKVAANNDGAVRKARLTVSVYNNVTKRTYSASTIVTQEAEAGYFRFANPDVPAEVESFAKAVLFDWTTNMEMFFAKTAVAVSYQEPGEEWITDIKLTPEGVQCNIQESTYDGERHATVTVTYNGPEGTVTAKRDVVQARPALEISYADLRGRLTSAGTLTLEKDYIMAQVISEPGNANLEMNPQPTWNTVDHSENAKTAYIQSLDGKYGFRVKLASEDDAKMLPRYATVKVALAGLTMEREDAPVRYTLRDFTTASVLECEPGNASMLPAKEKYINELTNDDIYTFVTFKDMEVAIPFGSWGNQHEGFSLKSDVVTAGNATQTRCDCTMRIFRDINGDKIPMLINSQTPWRRPGARIPQGSGTVKGIVVYSPLKRQNSNNEQGTYQFRVMSKDDIKLDATKSFSTRIVEWQWTGGASTIVKISGSDDKIGANYGEGIMDTDAPYVKTSNNRARTALTTGFMGYTFAAGSPSQAFRYTGQWWNFTTGKGASISWTFSTKGLTGKNLTMTFTCGTGLQAQPCPVPEKWNIEYSTDGGATFKSIKKNLVVYPSPIFAYTLGDTPAWNGEYVIDLPDELLGQENVTVRMQAASKKYLTSAGFNKGTLTATTANSTDTYVRFDAITFKYNKQ